jgi:hypothetical protein
MTSLLPLVRASNSGWHERGCEGSISTSTVQGALWAKYSSSERSSPSDHPAIVTRQQENNNIRMISPRIKERRSLIVVLPPARVYSGYSPLTCATHQRGSCFPGSSEPPCLATAPL